MTKDKWEAILTSFEDVHLCQTWSYGAARWGEEKLHHIVVTRGGIVVAAAQVAVVRMLLLRLGIAYVKWGPMWHPRGLEPDCNAYRLLLGKIRSEYAMGQKLLVRIMPRETNSEANHLARILEEEGFPRSSPSEKTWLIDLSQPIESLRTDLKRKWRACLNRAEMQDIEVREMNGTEGMDLFLDLQHELHSRKRGIPKNRDLDCLRQTQYNLPQPLKYKLIAAFYQDQPVAMTALSTCSSTAIASFGVTSPLGREIYASHYLDWWTVRRLKEKGFRALDLGGAASRSVNIYKAGLCGRSNEPVRFIGKFECRSARLSATIVEATEKASRRLRDLRTALKFRR